MAIHVREKPPLRQHLVAIAPSGKRYRWGEDEPRPENVVSDLRHSSTMPGGFESCDVTLPRRPGIDYADLERLTTLHVLGAGGEKAGEYRLERTPRVSGDRMAISPGAVGWQAHLEDDKSASMVYIDRDLSRWQGPSRQRVATNGGVGFAIVGHQVRPDATTGAASIATEVTGPWSATSKPAAEAWYDAGAGNLIEKISATWTRGPNVDSADANWSWVIFISTDDLATSHENSGNLRAAGPGTSALTAVTPRRFGLLQLSYAVGPAGGNGVLFTLDWTNVYVLGDHGLTLHGDAGAEGILASDAVAHAVGRWAPRLVITDESVQPSGFPLPQLAFFDRTTAGEIVRQATRFGLQDWAVWEHKTFWWHERGARGRTWRARIAPAQLEETGPQLDRLWESVIVQYRDADGSDRTVGPPGSGANTETADLRDDDPENPANRLGIIRRDLLVMGVGTAASATEVGRRFLEEQKLLDTSGRATLVGHVQDDRGVLHPYWKVRAGDQITFVDAADPSPRRIVRADHSSASRSCTVDLDAPPEGLAALLEQLGVVLIPLGL